LKRIAIVGGGASGLLVAINLLRKSDACEVTIFEPREKLGLGLAYSTKDLEHLLNVPAGRMSGLVEEPKSLCDWAKVEENDFISRNTFGKYLEFLLNRELNRGKKLEHVRAAVVNIESKGGLYNCSLENGTVLTFDAVVLALGNSESITPAAFDGLPKSDQVVRDVWRESLSTTYDRIAIVGTGLTFYDITLSILRDRPRAVIHGISRNGLLPRPHLRHRAPALPVPDVARESADGIRGYLTSMGEKWREAQDGIRHELQEIWANFPDLEKNRFVNEHFRWWNTLRHRSAPEIDERIKAEIAAGRIIIHKANVETATSDGHQIKLGLSDGKKLDVEQLINCSGNQFFATQPLIEVLVGNGFLARGPLDFGIACDRKTLALKNDQGATHENLYGIGPILVGELLETTAIPEIRVEAELIASKIMEN
jgi:hydroxyacylglutathione hydrolase